MASLCALILMLVIELSVEFERFLTTVGRRGREILGREDASQ